MVKTKKKKKVEVKQEAPVKVVRPVNDIIWEMVPSKVEHQTHHSLEWRTTCGRYKICHITSKYGPYSYFAAIRVVRIKDNPKPQEYLLEVERQADGKAKGHYVKKYQSLDAALYSVEQYHINKYGEVTRSNRTELVCHADKQQLAGVVKQETKDAPIVTIKKAAEKQSPKGKRGVGVIATIVECLKGASEKFPVTKEAILEVLKVKFPDREERAMKSTVSSQIPSGLKTEKGFIVKNNAKGYWLP
jgi:hypothetical protein